MKQGKKDTMEFTDVEKEAMKARALELRAEARISKNKALGEKEVLAKISQMHEPDRSIARRIHEIVKKNAPNLFPKTWYGMPAYANKEGKIICFFQSAQKFKTRYATFGFQPDAKLDEGSMWPVAFALKKLTLAEEKRIALLIKKAVEVES
jgi:uncharacterized protein YdhG (YjbR/CyaY superfamily)